MKVRLLVKKDSNLLYDGTHDVTDAESFGAACSDAWFRLHEMQVKQATSIGAAIEMINQNVLEDLTGAQISIRRA